MTPRDAAIIVVALFKEIQETGLLVDLQSCCCKERIMIQPLLRSTVSAVQIEESPQGWEINNA